MTTPKIVVDLDDTIASFVPGVIQLIQQQFNRTIDVTDLKINWMRDYLSETEWEMLRPLVYNETFYLNLPPAHEALSILNFLELCWKNTELHYVTARAAPLGDNAEDVTRAWLEKHRLPRGDKITIVHHQEDKVKHFPANTVLVVEDSPHVALGSEKAGIPVLLIDRPWNRDVWLTNPRSKRVPDMLSGFFHLLDLRERGFLPSEV